MQCANPSSLFSCICGLNYYKDLVGYCVCWGWGWWCVWMGVDITDMCGRVHAITDAFFSFLFFKVHFNLEVLFLRVFFFPP